ncbi:MAG: precorrin-2 dehydrogenase/sirohydrochlorin ferrochelatase family protein [Chthonomonadales bacterium]
MPAYYPIALNVEGRTCLIVGGGSVALRRAASLLEAGARVVVVAPRLHPELEALGAQGKLVVERKPFDGSVPEDAILVIAATDREAVNRSVVEASRRAGVPCGDASEAEMGDFVVPSTIRRGDLILAVTTCGQSPALAARIAGELRERYGPEYGDYVRLLGEMRREVLACTASDATRRDVLRRLAADQEILELVRLGRVPEARERARKCILSWLG